MPASKTMDYDDVELCQDIALAELTRARIAAKHGLSESMVNQIARGRSRPKLKVQIDGLIQAATAEARRIFKSRSRWLAARLLKLAEMDTDLGLRAILEALKLARLTVEPAGQTDQLREIRLVLTTEAGEKVLPINLTGVSNNNRFSGLGEDLN